MPLSCSRCSYCTTVTVVQYQYILQLLWQYQYLLYLLADTAVYTAAIENTAVPTAAPIQHQYTYWSTVGGQYRYAVLFFQSLPQGDLEVQCTPRTHYFVLEYYTMYTEYFVVVADSTQSPSQRVPNLYCTATTDSVVIPRNAESCDNREIRVESCFH